MPVVKQTHIDTLAYQISLTRSKIKVLENEKNPTLPRYDFPSNPPSVAIDGEVALDLTGRLWWYINEAWHTC